MTSIQYDIMDRSLQVIWGPPIWGVPFSSDSLSKIDTYYFSMKRQCDKPESILKNKDDVNKESHRCDKYGDICQKKNNRFLR